MKLELIKETRLDGAVFYTIKIIPKVGNADFKCFSTLEDAETWIDEYKYKLQETKSEILKTYEI